MAMALVRGALHILLFTLLYRDVTESHESNVGKCAQLEIFSEASTEIDSSNSKVEDCKYLQLFVTVCSYHGYASMKSILLGYPTYLYSFLS